MFRVFVAFALSLFCHSFQAESFELGRFVRTLGYFRQLNPLRYAHQSELII